MTKYIEAFVNGRFQPPHLGHLEYIEGAKAKCDFLWIGITRYNLEDKSFCAVDSHRSETSSNPLTYWERVKLFTVILDSAGYSRDSYGFSPFPIDQPELLEQFVPTSTPIFTTIYDDWNRHKINLLRKMGYTVEVLWERPQRAYAGEEVRSSIKNSSDDWERMVPTSAIAEMKRMQIQNRL